MRCKPATDMFNAEEGSQIPRDRLHSLPGGREVMNGLFGCIPTMRIPFGDDSVYSLSHIPSTCQQQKRLPKNERKTVRERVFY